MRVDDALVSAEAAGYRIDRLLGSEKEAEAGEANDAEVGPSPTEAAPKKTKAPKARKPKINATDKGADDPATPA